MLFFDNSICTLLPFICSWQRNHKNLQLHGVQVAFFGCLVTISTETATIKGTRRATISQEFLKHKVHVESFCIETTLHHSNINTYVHVFYFVAAINNYCELFYNEQFLIYSITLQCN